ncbi:hypothetical protein FF2_015390 [Malus domestica]
MVLGFLQIGPSLTLEAKVQINGCFPPPTGGGVAEGFPKMKQHEEYARAEVLSLQRKAAELHAKIIKVKMWTNYTPTPTPTYPKTIDNKNLARKAWTVIVGSQKPNFVNHVDITMLGVLDDNVCRSPVLHSDRRAHISGHYYHDQECQGHHVTR